MGKASLSEKSKKNKLKNSVNDEKKKKKKQLRKQRSLEAVEFREPYTIVISTTALVALLVVSSCLPFLFGIYVHDFLQVWRGFGIFTSMTTTVDQTKDLTENEPVFTFKQFDDGPEVRTCSGPFTEADESKSENKEQERLLCRHIFFDLEKVDPNFLASEERLTASASTLAESVELSLSYYSCHERQGSGVSCVVSFDQHRLSFTTWHRQGVLLADLIACEANADLNTFLPLVPAFEELFGIPDSFFSELSSPHMIWGQRKRGFRRDDEKFNPEDVDLEEYIADMNIEKTKVASVQTDFQRIDIYDLIEKRYRSYESYVKSISNDGSYESLHPEFFKKDRTIFLDNILQSRSYGEAAYHESLVHPALFTHDNPRRIAIIGGGEGATLREVLKHKTVEKVVMIDIDEVMVNTSRTYLPKWSDCSNLVGSASSCFDDRRADVHYEDAIAWFINNFTDKKDYNDEDLFDVIIMDALDPSSVVDFSDFLYNNEDLEIALSNALGDKGILVAQLGYADHPNQPPSVYGKERRILAFRSGLAKVGFRSMMEYDEAHCRLDSPWMYLIAMKSRESRTSWFASEAVVTLAMQQRTLPTKDGESPFYFFDASTMMTFQHPSRIVENIWCISEGRDVCQWHGFDPEISNYPLTSFERIKTPNESLETYTKVSISSGSYVGLETSVHSIFVQTSTVMLIQMAVKALEHGSLDTLYDTIAVGSGMEGEDKVCRNVLIAQGQPGTSVNHELPAFLSRQCHLENDVSQKMQLVYDPYSDRQLTGSLPLFLSSRDIGEGESVFADHFSCANHL